MDDLDSFKVSRTILLVAIRKLKDKSDQARFHIREAMVFNRNVKQASAHLTTLSSLSDQLQVAKMDFLKQKMDSMVIR